MIRGTLKLKITKLNTVFGLHPADFMNGFSEKEL